MEKLFGILSAASLCVVLVFAVGLMLVPKMLNVEITDRLASIIFIPFGLTFIFGILSNAAGGGHATLFRKTINRTENCFLYWSLAILPLTIGAGTLVFGMYQLMK
jgi:hypothetical protein